MVHLEGLPREFLLTWLAPKLDVPDLARMVQSYKEPLWREAFANRQVKLRNDLAEALVTSRKDGGGRANCWCYLRPPADQVKRECEKGEGTIARIVQRVGNYSVYRSYRSFNQQFDPKDTGTYLIRDDQSRVCWVTDGEWVRGEELEMEAMNRWGFDPFMIC